MRARSSRLVLLLAASLPVLWAHHAGAEDRLAIVIGHNLGAAEEDPLRFAERDAERFAKLLVELGGAREEDVLLLRAPARAEVDAALDRIGGKLRALGLEGRQASVLFYFAGHGDSQNLHLAQEFLSREDLLAGLKKLPCALKLVILDACQTARVEATRGVRSGPSFDIGVVKPPNFEGVVVIQSSQKGEPAHESDALEGAVFTHYWLSGLRGAADLDHDGRVTLLEAYTFAFRNTVRHSAGDSAAVQRPSFDIDLAGTGEVILTEPAGASATLVLPSGLEARYLIYQQPSGALLAEAVSSSGRTTSLAVPPGRLLVQRRSGERFQVAEVNLPFGGRYQLSMGEFSDQPYEQVARRGGTLELHPDLLTMDYSLRSDHLPGAWVWRQGPQLQFTHILGSWMLVAQLGLVYSRYDLAPYDTEETVLDLAARIAWWTSLGPSRLEVSAGPELSWILQGRQRQDQGRLPPAGIDLPMRERNTALGPGAGIDVTWRFPLGSRLLLQVSVRASLLALQLAEHDGTSWQPVPVLGAALGLGYRF